LCLAYRCSTSLECNLSYPPTKERPSLRRFSRNSKSTYTFLCTSAVANFLPNWMTNVENLGSFNYDLQVKHESICLWKIWLSLHRRFSRKLICADKHQAMISIPNFIQISRQISTIQAGSNLGFQPFNDELQFVLLRDSARTAQ